MKQQAKDYKKISYVLEKFYLTVIATASPGNTNPEAAFVMGLASG